ncbi:MAG TPA: fasciclin domain-containing protein [Thermoguttaceae bacterium]|nr:fasciclin domain-containing protein [Thermoguttaceae bacterium]
MSKKWLRGLWCVLIPALALGMFLTSAQAEQDIVGTAKSAGNCQTLCKALEAAKLIETLQGEGPFTVFAPTDEAFERLPQGALTALLADQPKLRGVLLLHVVPGKIMAADVAKQPWIETVEGKRIPIRATEEGVMIGRARVTKTDIPCTNGVIHIIDAVLTPELQDIVDTAKEAGTFQTLCKAVREADLVETLRGEGPFTVFAPTDEAFAKLPPKELEALIGDKTKLRGVLLHHVVPGKHLAAEVAKLKSVEAADGTSLSITASDGEVMIDQAHVTKPDIEAGNGVIHVIDTVLMPQ